MPCGRFHLILKAIKKKMDWRKKDKRFFYPFSGQFKVPSHLPKNEYLGKF